MGRPIFLPFGFGYILEARKPAFQVQRVKSVWVLILGDLCECFWWFHIGRIKFLKFSFYKAKELRDFYFKMLHKVECRCVTLHDLMRWIWWCSFALLDQCGLHRMLCLPHTCRDIVQLPSLLVNRHIPILVTALTKQIWLVAFSRGRKCFGVMLRLLFLCLTLTLYFTLLGFVCAFTENFHIDHW